MKKFVFASALCACLLGSGCVFVVAPGHHPDCNKISADKIEEHERDIERHQGALEEHETELRNWERELDKRASELEEREQNIERHENKR